MKHYNQIFFLNALSRSSGPGRGRRGERSDSEEQDVRVMREMCTVYSYRFSGVDEK